MLSEEHFESRPIKCFIHVAAGGAPVSPHHMSIHTKLTRPFSSVRGGHYGHWTATLALSAARCNYYRLSIPERSQSSIDDVDAGDGERSYSRPLCPPEADCLLVEPNSDRFFSDCPSL